MPESPWMPGEPRPDAALLSRDAFDDVEHLLFGMGVHLLVDVTQMGAHGSLRDEQLFLNAGGRTALGEQDHHLGLLRRELEGGGHFQAAVLEARARRC